MPLILSLTLMYVEKNLTVCKADQIKHSMTEIHYLLFMLMLSLWIALANGRLYHIMSLESLQASHE